MLDMLLDFGTLCDPRKTIQIWRLSCDQHCDLFKVVEFVGWSFKLVGYYLHLFACKMKFDQMLRANPNCNTSLSFLLNKFRHVHLDHLGASPALTDNAGVSTNHGPV